MRALTMSALLVLLPALGTAQGRIYLAYAEGEGGRPLGAYYSHGKLVALERRDWDLALATFRAGRVLPAVSDSGVSLRVRIDSVNRDAEYYEPVLVVSAPGRRHPPHFTLIVGAPSLAIHVVPHEVGTISTIEDAALRRRAGQLWREALQERAPEDSAARYTLRRSVVHALPTTPGIITVQYGVDITWPGHNKDDRASFFFIYSRAAGRILYGSFGHPEWAPSNNSTVLTVQPYLYFRVADGPSVYFLGDHSAGWESSGVAIYDLNTGRALIQDY